MRGQRGAVVGAVVVLASVIAAPSGRAASANVAALQVALSAWGLPAGPVDGITGPRTETALLRFQRRHRLVADGIAGPRTRRALGRRGRPALGARPMTFGTSGWDVAALQFLLGVRGFTAGAVDGGFGQATLAAVERYQTAVGLSTDGVAGAQTLHALRGRAVSAAAPTTSDAVRFLRPVAGPWTDGFGWVGGRRHTGLDFPEPEGTPVHAAGVGTVSWAGHNDGGYGNLVVVTHRLGYETWYAHLSAISVGVGAAVSGATVIGAVGATGHATGPHLHFEVRQFGTPIDPAPRLLTTVALRPRRAPSPTASACPPNADVRGTRDTDPPYARLDRCP